MFIADILDGLPRSYTVFVKFENSSFHSFICWLIVWFLAWLLVWLIVWLIEMITEWMKEWMNDSWTAYHHFTWCRGAPGCCWCLMKMIDIWYSRDDSLAACTSHTPNVCWHCESLICPWSTDRQLSSTEQDKNSTDIGIWQRTASDLLQAMEYGI